MSPTSVVVVILVIGCAMWVQTVVGFGYSLLAVPLMSFTVDPKMAVVIAASTSMLGSATLAKSEWPDCDRRTAARMILGAAIGSPFGLIILEIASERAMRLGLALALFGFVVVTLRGLRLQSTSVPVDLAFGAASGVLNTALSTGGPPLVVVLHARHLAPAVFRATLALIFTVSGVFAIVLFALAGRYDNDTIAGIGYALPAMLVGLGLGRVLRSKIPISAFRKSVLGLIVVTACASAVGAIIG